MARAPERLPLHINQVYLRLIRDDDHDPSFEDFMTLAAYAYRRVKAEQRKVLFWKMLQESADKRLGPGAASTRAIDGKREAIKSLRQIEKLNWQRSCPRKSEQALADAILATWGWPTNERYRFTRVLSEWLTGAVIGIVPEIDSYQRVYLAQQRATSAAG